MTEAVARPTTRPSPASVPAAAEPVDRPQSTAPATERPSLADLWQEADGDRDRYLGLLRDHGYARDRGTLGDLLQMAIDRWHYQSDDIGEGLEPPQIGDQLAPLLIDELGKHGYRIHDVARCVRPMARPGDPPENGRPMTAEEEAALSPATAAPPVDADAFEFATPEGDRFVVPAGWTPGDKSSRCRSCDALILWCLTRNQKRAPLNPDGTSHFASCPDAPSWRKSA